MTVQELNDLSWKDLQCLDTPSRKPLYDGYIFMGDGGKKSFAQCYMLHKLLEEAFESLNSLQQNGLYGYERNVVNEINDNRNLVAVVQQISTALLGHEVKFIGKEK